MTRKQVTSFTGPDRNWPGQYVGFYSDSGATTAVTVYADQIALAVLASGKTGSSPVRKFRADAEGLVPPAGVRLWVDSSVTTLYARPESATGVAVNGATAVSCAAYGPDGPVAPTDPSSNDAATKMPLLATFAWTSGALGLGVNTVDAAAGNKTPSLPTPAFVGQLCSAEKTDSSANTVTISGTIRGSAGTLVLSSQFQSIVFEAESLTSWRPLADHRTKASLDAIYAPLPTGSPAIGKVPTVTATSPLALDWETPAGGGADAAVVAGGNLGATYTLALASRPNVQLTGTLTANCAMTVTGMTAGCQVALLLAQDGTGSRTLTVNSTPVTVPSTAGAVFAVIMWSPDGTTLYVQPGATNGTNGTNGTKWFAGSGAPGTVTGAVTNDYYLRQSNGEVYQSTSGASTWSDLAFSLQGPTGAAGTGAIGNPIFTPASGGNVLLPYANGSIAAGTSFLMTNGLIYYFPLVILNSPTISAVSVNIATGGSAGALLRVGVFNDTGGVPSTVLADGGTVAATGTGTTTKSFTQALTPGRYWIGVVEQGAPATNITIGTVAAGAQQIVTTVPPDTLAHALALNTYCGYTQTGVTGALGTAASLTALSAATAPVRVAVSF